MVLLVVKGTVYPDEFTVQRAVSDSVEPGQAAPAHGEADASAAVGTSGASSIVAGICHIQNMRHVVRVMLLSANELAEEAEKRAGQLTEEQTSTLRRFRALIDQLYSRLKDKVALVGDREYDDAAAEIRELTTLLYPDLCTHAGGTEAAIQALYAMHEVPDLDEDRRLLVYHCRAILDPLWKQNEMLNEDDAALWFCGKRMESTLSKYCGRNEKSKVTVKVAPRGGPAPSGEPRIRYEDQRELFRHLRERREEFKALEESELRARVLQQSRGTVHLPTGAGTLPSETRLETSSLRPIYPRKEEHVVGLP